MSRLSNLQIGLEWYELLLWLFLVFIGAGFVYFYKAYNNTPKNKYLLQGYFIKVLGGLFFALIYIYYYKGGDTILYFKGALEYNDVFSENPKLYFELFFTSFDEYKELLIKKYLWIGTGKSAEEWTMLKLTSPFAFLGLSTFLGATYFFSLLSFFGSILLSKIMNEILPGFERIIFRINFLIPSVILWGSGLLKDTIALFCFSLICFFLFKVIRQNYNLLKANLFIIIPAFIIFSLKPYILVCFLPWVFISLFYKIVNKSKNPVSKFLIVPYLLLIFSSGLYLSSIYMLDSSSEYNSTAIYKKIESFNVWHTKLEGSAYSFGELEYTQIGLLKKFPQAVNVTLFRPYLWETSNVFSILSGIESFGFLLFFGITFINTRLNFFKIIRKDEFLFGCLFFVLFFAFAIGISAYNFGALVRFKIPLVAFFAFLILYVAKKNEQNKIKIIS